METERIARANWEWASSNWRYRARENFPSDSNFRIPQSAVRVVGSSYLYKRADLINYPRKGTRCNWTRPSCNSVVISKIQFNMKTSKYLYRVEPSMLFPFAELVVTKGNFLTTNCQILTRLFINHILDEYKFDTFSKGTSFKSPSASLGSGPALGLGQLGHCLGPLLEKAPNLSAKFFYFYFLYINIFGRY